MNRAAPSLSRSRRLVLGALAVFLLVLGVSPAVLAAMAEATDLRFGDHGNRTRIVIDFDRKVTFSARTALDPERLELDVAEVAWLSLTRPEAAGQTFELAGPTVYTLRQLVEYVSALVGKPRPVVPLPEGLALLQAGLMELAPQPLMSRDNVRSMRVDNVASGQLPGLAELGITPAPLSAVGPMIVGADHPAARLDAYRRSAGR